LPAGLGLRSANSSKELPAGLGLRSANFTLPAGLDLCSADSILSAGLGLRSARTINLPAGLGLCSANSSNLSADIGLGAASWNSNETFRLIDALSSEGAQFAPNFFRLGNFNSSKLIVMYSEISFHFCKDCRIFCEGVKEAIIDTINRNNLRALTFPNKSSKFAVASQAMVLSTAIREKSNGFFTPQKMIVDYSIAPAPFYNDFQLVVKSILIPSYEGALRAASKLIVICAFGLNKLIELI
jgi:hypothetical protein